MDYRKHLRPTPQSAPLPGREKEMIRNEAGGYVFDITDMEQAHRWLLTGSLGRVYYASEEDLTSQNLAVIRRCAEEDPVTLGKLITAASVQGINQHAPILALMILASAGSPEARKESRKIAPAVLRTASALYEFLSYRKGLRGWGRLLRGILRDWFDGRTVEELEYQFLKYQMRSGYSVRDILRLGKPHPTSPQVDELFGYFTRKKKAETLPRLLAYERLKADPSETEAVRAIKVNRFTHEMIPSTVKRTASVSEALFQGMPVGATIRELGHLTEAGVFADDANLALLGLKLSRENLIKAKIHPVKLASALAVYGEGGAVGRGHTSWIPDRRVVAILREALEDRLEVGGEPTRKRILHAVDVSGSMHGAMVEGLWLSSDKVARIMALAALKSEPYAELVFFDTQVITSPIWTRHTSFDEAMGASIGGGGTDCSAPIKWACSQKRIYDAMVIWTDTESWAGIVHASARIVEYRKATGLDTKIVEVACAQLRGTITEPKDERSYRLCGFGANTPELLALILSGDIS